MTPEELVVAGRLPLPHRRPHPRGGLEILRARRDRAATSATSGCSTEGYPAYTTTPGWLGYYDEKLDRLAREAVADGFSQIKLKVGADLDDDVRRMQVARAAVGAGVRIAVDANQRWDVGDAIDWMRALAPFDPYWIEEPTSPDDVLGHAAIRRAVDPDQGRHRRARRTTGSCSSSCSRPAPSTSCRSTPPGSAGVNENLADPAARRQVRRAGLPARRRRRAVRAGPAPVDVRLRRRLRHLARTASSSTSTTCTSTSSPRYAWSAAATSPHWRLAGAGRCSPPRWPVTAIQRARSGRAAGGERFQQPGA